ncbi:type VI secretion system protein TssA [Comamonas sp. JC664]|uniref:type VI secretion system protein TssA n=1 Tax=Comamonas sp. JC664 TaxID=2801917 RepID=UPI00174EAF68|nr:type VI secretion system protein TssA [Comamonas sp. JC664]MBL0697208.1 type VI secretion system protein TssA [Comamonas sp. JC664]GHG83125.1 hypothetical protein GCM10012319_37800 [Comamonas sp. KCTC 72670]
MPPTLEQLRERALPWLEPVPGASPAGVQAKHDAAYEAVAMEVAKLESPAGKAVRWDEVVEGASDLLKHTTKDLWLASYLAYGLYVTKGVDGAATGAAVLAEVTERYWPDLFPELKRLRGRANAVAWFVERLGRILPTVEQSAVSAETLDALSVAVKRLSQLSRERFPDMSPAFGPLQEAIARLRAGLPEPEPEPEAPAAAPEEPLPPGGDTVAVAEDPAPAASDTDTRAAPEEGAAARDDSGAAGKAPIEKPDATGKGNTPAASAANQGNPSPPAGKASTAPQVKAATPQRATPPVEVPPLPELPSAPDLSNAEAVTDFLRTVGGALLDGAGALRRASAEDPLSYRLTRLGLWLHLSQPPTPQGNGNTAIPPLPEPLSAKLEVLAKNQRWSELLDESEAAVSRHRFALTLHRYSAMALEGLGAPYAGARAALVQELGIQLRRMTGVETLRSNTGTPLTDEATQDWLRAEVLRANVPAAGPAAAATPLALAPLSLGAVAPAEASALEAEARSLLAEGRVHDAVTRLQLAVTSASTGRNRFIARLELARLCANAGHVSLARAVFDALDEEVSAHALDTWEPALAAACLEGWLQTRTLAEKESGPVAVKFRNRYRRLALLDSSATLRVGA